MADTRKSTGSVDAEIGRLIRVRRMLIGMSQGELGRRAGGITFQQIQKYEKGTNRISVGRLHQIADALEVPIEFFYARARGADAGTVVAKSAPDFATLLLSTDSLRLMKAFMKIDGPKLRRTVVRLAEALAKRST